MDVLPPGLHGAHRISDLRRTLGRYQLAALVGERRLVPFSRGVLVERERQLDFRTRAAATLMVAGGRAVLTNHTAARLFGCGAAESGQVHVLVDYHRRLSKIPGSVTVHHGSFEEQDVVVLDGLRTMVLEHAIAELLCRERRRDALACLDQALALTPPERRGEFRAEVLFHIGARPDPRGRRRSQILLNLATGLAESPAESWLLLDLYDERFPLPAQQFPVRDIDGRERYRLDFAWEEARVALEYDGYVAHADRAARDELRDADLRRRGWLVVHADADDLKDPARLHAAIRTAFRARRFAA